MKTLKLINSEENKFYTMEQLDDSTFKSTWGKIGDADTITTNHDLSDWDSLIATKKTMGFVELSKESRLLTSFSDFKNMKIVERMSVVGDSEEFSEDDLAGFNIADRIMDVQQKIIDGE